MEAEVNEVNINGKMYVAKNNKQLEITGDIKIVVLQRGWIVVGRFYREKGGTQCKLYNASTIRIWGTTQGLGEIAGGGPTISTRLDKCRGVVEFDYMTVVLTIDCAGEKWQDKL